MPDPKPDAPAKSTELTSRASSSQAVVEISPGQDLIVVLNGGNVKLKIEQDFLGKISISGIRTGSLRSTMVERPGSFDVTLARHRYGDKFDFFGLPGEIRNEIYSLIFNNHDSEWPLAPGLAIDRVIPDFANKRALRPTRFLARLNKLAYGGFAFPFLNHQALRETAPWLMSSHFGVKGDKQVLALLRSIESIGFCGLKEWSGSLWLYSEQWQEDCSVEKWVPMLFNSGWSREIVVWGLNKARESRFKFADTPIGQQLVALGGGSFPTFAIYFETGLHGTESREAQINHALSGFGDPPSGLILPREMLLAKRIYEMMARSVRGEIAQRQS